MVPVPLLETVAPVVRPDKAIPGLSHYATLAGFFQDCPSPLRRPAVPHLIANSVSACDSELSTNACKPYSNVLYGYIYAPRSDRQ